MDSRKDKAFPFLGVSEGDSWSPVFGLNSRRAISIPQWDRCDIEWCAGLTDKI